MKSQTVILLALVVCLALGGGAMAQSGKSEPRDGAGQAIIAGGHYQLVSELPSSAADAGTWQVSGAASGGAYRLLASPAPARAASGCCCTYLPCAMRRLR